MYDPFLSGSLPSRLSAYRLTFYMNQASLYFIGILLPGPVGIEIQKLKEHFLTRYNVKHALKSPPHITLIPPFKRLPDHEPEMMLDLDGFSSRWPSFDIQLENFGAFKPRVIYIRVNENDSLTALYRCLNDHWNRQMPREETPDDDQHFRPHVTLAFRDLRREQFHDAWPDFRERKISYEFTAEGLTLFKHDGRIWRGHHTSPFLRKNNQF
jgi:2'-5' RNA ligase